MFPLDDMFWAHAGVFAWLGMMAILARVSLHFPWFWLVLILPILGFSYYRYLPQNQGQYEGLGDLILVAGALTGTGLAVAFAVILRAAWPSLPIIGYLGIVITACAFAIGVRFELQRVPESTCSREGIRVRVADAVMYVPVELNTRLEFGAPKSVRGGVPYGRSPSAKRGLKKVCRIAGNGTETVDVGRIQFHTASRLRAEGVACPFDDQAFCAGYPEATKGAVSEIIISDGESQMVDYARQWYSPPNPRRPTKPNKKSLSMFADGVPSVCTYLTVTEFSTCMAWDTLESGPSIFVQGQDVSVRPEFKVNHYGVRTALEWARERLEPVE